MIAKLLRRNSKKDIGGKPVTNSIEGPRIMHPEEYDEIIDLAEKSFGYTKQHLLNYYPQAQREGFVFEDHFVIKEDKRLVSHVWLCPMEAIADGSKIKVGGIGDVETHPDYCGKGYMGKLINHSIRKMKEREIPLSILWGDTQRYRHYGWETSGREIIFHLNHRSIRGIKAGKEFTLRGYNGKEDLDRIIEIHESEPLRLKRSRRDYEKIFKKIQIQVWMGNETNSWSYAVLDGKKVVEFGGDPSLMAKVFSFIISHYSESLNIHFPYYKDSEMLRTLFEISASWEIVPLGMIKIIDLKGTLLSFNEQIKNKMKISEIGKGYSFTFRIADSDQKASLIIDEETEIKDKDSSNLISLSEIEMVRLLFSQSPGKFTENGGQEKLLASFFPLDFYLWELDHV